MFLLSVLLVKEILLQLALVFKDFCKGAVGELASSFRIIIVRLLVRRVWRLY